MARFAVTAALVALALAMGASAQLDCYETTGILYPPPPPPSPPITGIPPISIPPVPNARDYMVQYLSQYGANIETWVIGTQRAVASVGRPYSVCLQEDFTITYQVTAPSDAAGLRSTSSGREVYGLPGTTCAAINALAAIPSPPSPPLSAGCFTWTSLYTYTLCPTESSSSGFRCCETNLCNDGGATITTRLAASSTIANMVLLALSALACLVLSKML